MSGVPPVRGTVAIASDIAVHAATEFDRLLASFTEKGVIEGPDPTIWSALDSAGWLAAGESSGGDELRLLDLIELAIVWGRHLIPGPFLTTLLARRHLGAGASASPSGYTYALFPGTGAWVP